MRTKAELLIKSLHRTVFTEKETQQLVEISRLEAFGDGVLLTEKVKEFKSQFEVNENDWLDFCGTKDSVSIDFDGAENLTITQESKDSLRLTIKGLGEFTIPKKSLFDGIQELRNLNPGTKPDPIYTLDDPSSDGNTAQERRYRLDLNTPAEKIIYDSIQEVEKLGCDVKLTEAVNLLSEARNLVSDFEDSKI